jgi:hypothetical protein
MTDPLVSLDDFAELVGTVFDDADPAPRRVLEMASTFIRTRARETFSLDTEDVQLRGNWSSELQLPRPPVFSVNTVELRCGGDTVYSALATDAFIWDRMGLLTYYGGSWGGSRGVVHVVYSRGYAEVPESIQSICLSVAKRLFVYKDRFSDGQVRAPDAGVSVGFTELEAEVLRSFEPVSH